VPGRGREGLKKMTLKASWPVIAMGKKNGRLEGGGGRAPQGDRRR